jgi:hypothetical protein
VWLGENSLGVPVFRSYQSLAHYLAAFILWIFRGMTVGIVVHCVTSLAFLLHGFSFYIAGLKLGLPRRTAVFAGWLAPMIASHPQVFGESMESYTFSGFGLFTQVVGIPFFVLSLACLARVMGWSDKKPELIAAAWEAGIWTSLAFLCHFFLGYTALLCIPVLAVCSLSFRGIRFSRLLFVCGIVGVVFVMGTGHQLLSLFQDGPLLCAFNFGDSIRWDGYGFERLLLMFSSGFLFDYERLPVFLFLIASGILAALRPRSLRSERSLIAFFLVGFALLCGRVTFGSVLNIIPGMEKMQIQRFTALLQISCIFLAGLGLNVFVSIAESIWKRKKGVSFAMGFVALFSIAYLTWNRVTYLKADLELLNVQTEKGSDDLFFKKVMRELPSGSNLYVASIPFGRFSYRTIANSLEIPVVPDVEDNVTYAGQGVSMFHSKIQSYYLAYGVGGAIFDPSFEPPPFLEERQRNDNVAYYAKVSPGLFDVVHISASQTVPDDFSYFLKSKVWFDSSDPELSRYLSVVPFNVATKWPEAMVPSNEVNATQSLPHGKVESFVRRFNGYSATLIAGESGLFGLVRNSFHPRWKIRINGHAVASRWVLPGFMAFRLEPGRNAVEMDFVPDPNRVYLFVLGWLSLGLGAIGVFVVARAPARSNRMTVASQRRVGSQ